MSQDEEATRCIRECTQYVRERADECDHEITRLEGTLEGMALVGKAHGASTSDLASAICANGQAIASVFAMATRAMNSAKALADAMDLLNKRIDALSE